MEKTFALGFVLRPAAVAQAQWRTRNETPWDHNGLGWFFQLLEVNDHSLERLTQAAPWGKQPFLSPLSITLSSPGCLSENRGWSAVAWTMHQCHLPSFLQQDRSLSPALLEQKPATQEF